MRKWTEELNKRIYEHDTATEQGFDRPEVTLQVQNTVKNQDKGAYFVNRNQCPISIFITLNHAEPSVLQTEPVHFKCAIRF